MQKKPAANAYKAPEAGVKIGFTAATDAPRGHIAITGAGIVAIPAGAKRVDAKGKTIVPGFIDAHWHGAMGATEIIPQQSWINHASLAFGLTTIYDPSNRNGDVFTQAEMQRAGLVVGPRI